MNFRNIIFILFLILSVSFFSCKSGNEVMITGDFHLRAGVNVSHWLSQSNKRGDERAKYIVEADFDTIAACGFDHVRIPFDEEQLWDEKGSKNTEAFELLHNAISWALKNKLRVIADLHIIRSHHFIAEERPLFTDPEEQDKLVDMWNQLSDELNQYPVNALAYEILNEAVAENPEDWNKLIAKVVKSIREKEPERTIVIGSNKWQQVQTFPDLKVPANDKNIILSFHFYNPMALTHHTANWTSIAEYNGPVNYPGLIVDTSYYSELSEGAVNDMREFANGYYDKNVMAEMMKPALKVAKENNLPLYCGEFGVYPAIPEEISLRYYKDLCDIFNENNIAYAHWCYKGDFPIVGMNSVPNKKLVSILTSK